MSSHLLPSFPSPPIPRSPPLPFPFTLSLFLPSRVPDSYPRRISHAQSRDSEEEDGASYASGGKRSSGRAVRPSRKARGVSHHLQPSCLIFTILTVSLASLRLSAVFRRRRRFHHQTQVSRSRTRQTNSRRERGLLRARRRRTRSRRRCDLEEASSFV